MFKKIKQTIHERITNYLVTNVEKKRVLPLSNFERVEEELRHGDVILVEGRTHVAKAIRRVTSSPWTHAALYIGRPYDYKDEKLLKIINDNFDGDPAEPLVIETMVGKGVIISPLSNYSTEHIRICRPKGLFRKDAKKVVEYHLDRMGVKYDVRHIIDLGRILLPWGIFPRRWRSSLYSYKAGEETRLTCPLLLAEAFASVNFPILPMAHESETGQIKFVRRNPRLFTPSDFDFSPFFEIVKYPIVEMSSAVPVYHNLPWSKDEVHSDDDSAHFVTEPPVPKLPDNTEESSS